MAAAMAQMRCGGRLSSVRSRAGVRVPAVSAPPRPHAVVNRPGAAVNRPRAMFDDDQKEKMRKKMEREEQIVDVDSAAHARLYQLESLEAMFKLPSEGEKAEEPPETDICCAQCGSLVARARDRATIRRKHEHQLWTEDRSGMISYVCYEEAVGVDVVGEPELVPIEDLPKAKRSNGMCRRCGAKLGWKYERCPIEGTIPFHFFLCSALKPAAE